MSACSVSAITFNHSGCGSGVDLPTKVYKNRSNFIFLILSFGSSLLSCISVHVGILALWVHPGDNIHGYIPLSILVLA